MKKRIALVLIVLTAAVSVPATATATPVTPDWYCLGYMWPMFVWC